MIQEIVDGWKIKCTCGKEFSAKGELFEVKAQARSKGFSMRMKKIGGYVWFCEKCKPKCQSLGFC
jgi:hypothetical protein